MTVGRDTLLFFDASCLIAAAGSPTGGSAFLLSVCSRGFLKAVVSQPVLLEAERNVLDNLGNDAVTHYYRLVATTPMKVVALPSPTTQPSYEKMVGEKDAHVLAAAVVAEAPFLITLDQGLEKRVNEGKLAVRALSPGGFIKTILTQHRDYPTMR
jgi:predicted nucleic acid-binding protein